MREEKNELKNRPSQEENQGKNAVNTSDDAVQENNQFSLNDDRRVKVLSPGTLVVKRFFAEPSGRCRPCDAAVHVRVLASWAGLLSPYGEDEQFYTYTNMEKEYVGVVQNKDFRYVAADGQDCGSVLQAQFLLAVNKQEDSFTYKDVTYDLTKEGEDFYTISTGGVQIGMASKDIVNAPDDGDAVSYDLRVAALKAYTNGETSFTLNGTDYTLDDEGNVMQGDTVMAYISRFVVQSKETG